jgi:copper chaperone CopZ
LVKVDGFKKMDASPQEQRVTVTYDPEATDPAELAAAINEHTDFEATPPSG